MNKLVSTALFGQFNNLQRKAFDDDGTYNCLPNEDIDEDGYCTQELDPS